MENKQIPNEQQFNYIQDKVDLIMNRSKYNKVDLG